MLNPLEYNELQKAMILRGVDYETSELIIHDFRVRCVELLGAERYHKIMQAEREKRLVILPCKVGDTVYKWGWKYSECHLGFTPSYKPCSECEGCCAECDSEKTEWLYSGEVRVIRVDADGVLVQVAWKDKWDTSWYNVGKTVFLTREEAEKILEEEK